MAINLSIPVYAGGYRMDADALQAEMIEVRDKLLMRYLSPAERRSVNEQASAVFDKAHEDGEPLTGFQYRLLKSEMESQAIAIKVNESDKDVQYFNQLRARMERDYGIVA